MRSLKLALLLIVLSSPAGGELPRELPGTIETLAAPQAHWVWVSDLVLERTALVDTDSGKFLGLVNGGYGAIAPLVPRQRPELYLATTYFSRRTHGERTDLLEVHDLKTLALITEIPLPARRAIDAVPTAHAALSDDDRFVAVFNWTPRTSLSIVDVEQRKFTSEIEIAGCSLVYAAGPRRFLSLCGDGSALVVVIDDQGKEVTRKRSEPFFDPKKDPVTEKAVRFGDEWLFVSFDGWVYPVDVSAADLSFGDKWSLISDADRGERWRIGGWQHLAVHQRTGTLYSLVHRGGPDTHKEPGEEIWVYSLHDRQRRQRIRLRNPGVTIYGFPIEVGKSWPWPFSSLAPYLIDKLAPASVSHIQVTPDEHPLLITAAQYSGALGIYDGLSGEWQKRVMPVGWTTDLLTAPWGGANGAR